MNLKLSPSVRYVCVLIVLMTSFLSNCNSRFRISNHDKFLRLKMSIDRLDKNMLNFSLKESCSVFSILSHSALVNMSAIIWYTSSKMVPEKKIETPVDSIKGEWTLIYPDFVKSLHLCKNKVTLLATKNSTNKSFFLVP